MHFEAESNDDNYSVKLNESRTHWKISIKKNDTDWVHHEVNKLDFQNLGYATSFMFKGQSYLVDVVGQDTDYTVYTRGSFRSIKIFNDEMLLHESLKSGGSVSGGDSLVAGMPGKIVKIFVQPNQVIKKDEPLLIMEAMKMENEMCADRDVVIKDVQVTEGETIESGSVLITFE